MVLLLSFLACSGDAKESLDSSDTGTVDTTTDPTDTSDTSTDSGKDTDTGKEGNPKVGADLYASSCAACHGADGKLGVEVGGVPAADLTVKVPSLPDPELMKVMQNGTGQMPAQLKEIPPAQNCLAYLRQQFGEYTAP
jgi:mono/diheme cytochrome c family protein